MGDWGRGIKIISQNQKGRRVLSVGSSESQPCMERRLVSQVAYWSDGDAGCGDGLPSNL